METLDAFQRLLASVLPAVAVLTVLGAALTPRFLRYQRAIEAAKDEILAKLPADGAELATMELRGRVGDGVDDVAFFVALDELADDGVVIRWLVERDEPFRKLSSPADRVRGRRYTTFVRLAPGSGGRRRRHVLPSLRVVRARVAWGVS